MTHSPLIGVANEIARHEKIPLHHRAVDKYLDVVISLGALPVVIPAFGLRADPVGLLERLDGLLLSGSISNVSPKLYGREQEMETPVENPERDATTLPLIRAALAKGVPLFAICRGIQELNVALGGTLHQQLDKRPGSHMHLSIDRPYDELFEPAHEVSVTLGSKLYEWLGEHRIVVNSAHNQAIDDLAPGLVVEAKADDGTVEAVRVLDSPAFAYGVQWHPEHKFITNPVSQALFGAFGEAVKEHARRHDVLLSIPARSDRLF